MDLDLKLFPDDRDDLRVDCIPVDPDDISDDLVDAMVREVRDRQALGLAAPQIGRDESITVVQLDGDLVPMINPDIIHQEGKQTFEEGCLSFPGLTLDIERSSYIECSYINRDGHRIESSFEGFPATIVQHEIDHLNGTLFIDHLDESRVPTVMRSYRRLRKRMSSSRGQP